MHLQCSLGTCKWVSASLLASCKYQLSKAHLSFGDCVLDFINRAAVGVHGSSFTRVFFSFVGELTKTSARPNAGRDI